MISSKTSTFSNWLLRFALIYWVLYIYPYGFEYLDWMDTNKWSFWEGPTVWFGETFFGWTFDENRLSKGFDSKYDFSRFSLLLVLSLLFAIAWWQLDKLKKWEYSAKTRALLQTILRYHVGITMLLYGLAKVYLYQFGHLGADRLDTSFGDLSPMRLLWTFMSYSETYNIATGGIEAIGGVLLLFRKTTLLGALLCLAAMVNVVLLDISYDVTVKMFAIHLMLMVLSILWRDIRVLVQFIVFQQKVSPLRLLPRIVFPNNNKLGLTIKALLVGYLVIAQFVSSTDIYRANQSREPFRDVIARYDVQEFTINRDTLSAANSESWTKIFFSSSYNPYSVQIRRADESQNFYRMEIDSAKNEISFHPFSDTSDAYNFHYSDQDSLVIWDGIHQGDTIHIKAKVFKTEDFRLISNGTNWIRDLQ